MQIERGQARRRGHMRSRMLAVLTVVALALLAFALWRVGPAPHIEIEPGLPGIGPRTPLTVRLSEPSRGLGDYRIELVQGERTFDLVEESFRPRPFWAFWGPRELSSQVQLAVGRDSLADLQEGTATIRVVASRAGTWLRRPDPAIAELELPVRLSPPSVQLLSQAVHVRQGGSGLVVYRVGKSSVRDGVQAGDWWFPSFVLPGGAEGARYCLFAAPYDDPNGSGIQLVAHDEVGNEARLSFISTYTSRPPRQATIQLNESFMARVVPEILARSPEVEEQESLLASYLVVNGKLRRINAEALVELSRSSRPEFLWTQPFRQLGNSQVMASFADQRTYMLDGEAVDHQDHLGFDLASYRRAPVEAANRGVVSLARYFGIYGNTVVLDHGGGLMSLYSHLSSIEVEEGQSVEAGQILGRTGQTGLAGGDHLHFSMMVHGLPVNPLEWWDATWVRNRITRQLAGGS